VSCAVWQPRVWVSVLVVLWIAGCTPAGTTVGTGPQETTISGRFTGEARGDAGCAWLQTDDQRIEVSYPNAWRVDFDPLGLYDEAGRLRAKGGDTIVAKGYFQEVGASVCQPERMFAATEVTVTETPP
jgi:hypothetical protein